MQAILKRILERSVDPDWRPSTEVLQSAWPGLVGERLAAVTEPREVDWERGRLVVATASETWQRELERHEHRLLDRIDRVLPWKLQSLHFAAAHLETDTAREPPARTDDEPAEPSDRADREERIELPDDLESSLASLDDGAEASARRILGHLRQEDQSDDA